MIEINIKATNGSHLRKQLLDLLGMYPAVEEPEKVEVGQLFDEEEQALANIEPEAPPEPVKRGRGRPRTKPLEAPVAAPVAAPEPETDPLEEAIDALTNQVDAESLEPDEDAGYTIDVGSVGNAVDNEMLKREVIASLSDMFTAGQVKTVRHVLHKYGRGAKSFPEIDAAHFPEIKAALERNEAA